MRYGGDEFLVISSIPLCDTDFINTQYTIEASKNKHFKLSFSIGEVSIHRNQQLSLEEAVSLADTKMYEIKKEKSIPFKKASKSASFSIIHNLHSRTLL